MHVAGASGDKGDGEIKVRNGSDQRVYLGLEPPGTSNFANYRYWPRNQTSEIIRNKSVVSVPVRLARWLCAVHGPEKENRVDLIGRGEQEYIVCVIAQAHNEEVHCNG